MKKLIAISAILWLSVLAGCSQQGLSQQALSQSELFEKKQECTKYKDIIQKEVDKSLIRDDDEYMSYDVYLKDIFYSPVKNSCLYGVYYIYQDKSDPADTCGTYIIQDYLNNNEIVGSYLEIESTPKADNELSYICLWNKWEEAYNKAVKELKGE